MPRISSKIVAFHRERQRSNELRRLTHYFFPLLIKSSNHFQKKKAMLDTASNKLKLSYKSYPPITGRLVHGTDKWEAGKLWRAENECVDLYEREVSHVGERTACVAGRGEDTCKFVFGSCSAPGGEAVDPLAAARLRRSTFWLFSDLSLEMKRIVKKS